MAELLVVATPIGNLNDLSPRMAEALSRADLIAAEDTRVTMKLLNHLHIPGKPMVSLHRHNEEHKAPGLIERMIAEDLTVAFASDAGTPGISDPGAELTRLAHRAGIRVTPICGPSAAITALSVSGFDAREFTFYGFLPREKKPLREKLASMRGAGVAVAYESPHRVLELVEQIEQTLPGANLCVCCDLTKKFELILCGPCGEVLETMRANPNIEKGEYVLVTELPAFEPAEEKQALPAGPALLSLMLEGMGLEEAHERLQPDYPRNELYKARLAIKKRFGA